MLNPEHSLFAISNVPRVCHAASVFKNVYFHYAVLSSSAHYIRLSLATVYSTYGDLCWLGQLYKGTCNLHHAYVGIDIYIVWSLRLFSNAHCHNYACSFQAV